MYLRADVVPSSNTVPSILTNPDHHVGGFTALSEACTSLSAFLHAVVSETHHLMFLSRPVIIA